MSFVNGDVLVIGFGLLVVITQLGVGLRSVKAGLIGGVQAKVDAVADGQTELASSVNGIREQLNGLAKDSKHADELILKDLHAMDDRLNGRIKRLEEDRSAFLAK